MPFHRENLKKEMNMLLNKIENNDYQAHLAYLDMLKSFLKQGVHQDYVRRGVGELRRLSSDAWEKLSATEPSLSDQYISEKLLDDLRDPAVFKRIVKNAHARKLHGGDDAKLQGG